MPDYGLVAREINNLSNRIGGIGERKRADELAMSNLGLQKAQFGLQKQNVEGQQALQLKKAEREQWLTEPVTIGQAIDTHPKWTPEQKQAIKTSIPEQVRENFLNHPTTRAQLNQAMDKMQSDLKESQYRESQLGLEKQKMGSIEDYRNKQLGLEQQQIGSTADYRNKQLALERDKLNMMKQNPAKDNRANMQKEVEYISQVKGIPPVQALQEWQRSKSLPERIRLYNNELSALNEDLTLSPKDKPAKIEQLRQLYGISDAMEKSENEPTAIRMVYDPQTNKLVPK